MITELIIRFVKWYDAWPEWLKTAVAGIALLLMLALFIYLVVQLIGPYV